MNEMTVTAAQYVERTFGGQTYRQVEATIDGETMQVPLDNDNRHYQAILDWVADGNTIQDAD